MGTIRKTGLIDETHIRDEQKDDNEPDKDNSKVTPDEHNNKSTSTKIEKVLLHLDKIWKIKISKEKVIIASQFTKLLTILQSVLTKAGHTWTRLDGTMNIRNKGKVLSEFKSSHIDAPQILLLSLRAGGLGLNLTCANKLILLDPAWNPSVEEQCFDRIHRLGQTKEVEIIKFVFENSIERRMLDIQRQKQALVSGAFQKNKNGGFKPEDVLRLVGIHH